jgi:hypothetical protein
LPRELPGTGSRTRHLGRVRYLALAGFAAASRQFASKLAPTPSGQKRDGAQPGFLILAESPNHGAFVLAESLGLLILAGGQKRDCAVADAVGPS